MTDKIRFTKMHSSGNDYIYINTMERKITRPEQLAKTWSDRHKGIGADGLVLIDSSNTADFAMRIFNSDGSEAQMCGNACICIGKYLYEKHLTNNTVITLETKAGIKKISLYIEDNMVNSTTIDMGQPEMANKSLVNSANGRLINSKILLGNTEFNGTFVCMGNPHVVIFVENADVCPTHIVGPQIEHNPLFPQGTNVEFAQILSPNTIKVKVWERGTGMTQSCGTGACATLVAANTLGLAEKNATICMDGGNLNINWCKNSNHIYLRGEGHIVYEGFVRY